ncbi:hypothetical protein PEX1_008590 [Penicillium expansum]|uniref:Uncharacterized protein n=1 Tax=Penicillium expansum TaxID=27334 RepID=A0A0A2JFJ8_PENEN|nr:hypothetical protein PEX2_025460 [Penicillium expansum]KGO49213.1 hypothetical protein PEXP_012620 [Penicillium expansum]KGO54144.1 hypothetical protein PEX2_025460 [Penicillium expansum]KGO61574.1 hypothetical protein PEX1_008590 [Penicillium expansum]
MLRSFVVSCGFRCRSFDFFPFTPPGQGPPITKAGSRYREQSYQIRVLYVCPARAWCCEGEKMSNGVPNQHGSGKC